MDYTHLGRSGLSVSRLVLGTMNFGPITEEPDAHRIMDRAIEHGINFLDTANVYGWKQGEGITEQIIGRWFTQGGGRREAVVIATPLYGGLLGGVLKKEREGRRRTEGRAKEFLDGHHEQVQAYEDLCEDIGHEPAHVGLAWLLSRPGVTGPIIGPRTIEQLDDALVP